jgi:transposase InsO family protein
MRKQFGGTRRRRGTEAEMNKTKGSTARADPLVLVGVTGDLAYKMIFPVLYAIAKRCALKVAVIGWAMGHRLTVDLAEQALTIALANRNPQAGPLHHSERGSQYAATRYQQRLGEYSITASMSRKGNCWDNACVESFSGTRKRELVYHRHYETREAARQDIFKYIEVFYHRRRRHSILGYHSPAEYEAKTAVA